MRRPVIAGNWKLNLTSREAVALVAQLKRSVEKTPVAPPPAASAEGGFAPEAQALRAAAGGGVEVVVCPPFTALAAVEAQLTGSSIALGAQDLFWEPQGAFTGEVSAPMLADLGCRYCIIGHSERRQHFGETDETVRKKLRAALQYGLTPMVCVGETLKEREAGQTFEVVRRQVQGGLNGLSAQETGKIILAYEPVWAIGTGRNATPGQAQEAQAFIRQLLKDGWGMPVAEAVRIQYGGSVNAANALELLQQPDVDGALVGGASLKADAFAAIVKAAADAKLVTR